MNAQDLQSETGSEIVSETVGSEIGTGIVIGFAIGNAISSVVMRGEHCRVLMKVELTDGGLGPPLVFVETELLLLLQGRLHQVLAAAPTDPVLGLLAGVEVTDINHIGVSVHLENLESLQQSLLSQHLDDHLPAQAH